MVACYFLRERSAAGVFEEDEVADEVEEASFVEDAFDHYL
jgi:hypothetical protein